MSLLIRLWLTPTWNMGRVITTNSATLVNKGLELLEAHLLYGVDLDRIDVVVHPQSIVHSMVQFVDGSTLAQCSPPNMKLPIALGLSWPDRLPGVARPCDWRTAASWTFEPLDNLAFPAVELARVAGRLGGTAPAVYNAANEVCVDAFHDGRIGFDRIIDVVALVLTEHTGSDPDVGSMLVASDQLTLEVVLAADAWAPSPGHRPHRSNGARALDGPRDLHPGLRPPPTVVHRHRLCQAPISSSTGVASFGGARRRSLVEDDDEDSECRARFRSRALPPINRPGPARSRHPRSDQSGGS